MNDPNKQLTAKEIFEGMKAEYAELMAAKRKPKPQPTCTAEGGAALR